MKEWRGIGWAITLNGELMVRPDFIKPHVAFTKKGAEQWVWASNQKVEKVEVIIRKRRVANEEDRD